MKQFHHLHHSSSLLLIMITLIFTTTLAESPASSPPAPSTLAQSPTSSPAPSALAQSPTSKPASSRSTNIIAILEKAGKFSIMIRLLRNTLIGDQINTQVSKSNQGLTFFAPPDTAFNNLPSGIINSLTAKQKTELVEFHVLPIYVPFSQFQTLTNPVRTQAGNSDHGQFPLNVSTSENSVSMSTGVVNAQLGRTIYTNGKLAVYQVDHVLLPMQFHVSLAPALAPSVPEKKQPITSTSSADASVRITKYTGVSFGVAVIAAIVL